MILRKNTVTNSKSLPSMSSKKVVNRQAHRREQTAEGPRHHTLHSPYRLLMVQQTVLNLGCCSPG